MPGDTEPVLAETVKGTWEDGKTAYLTWTTLSTAVHVLIYSYTYIIGCVKREISRWRHFPIRSHPSARSRRLWCTRGPRRRSYQRLPPGHSIRDI